jgi:hypothetical protein
MNQKLLVLALAGLAFFWSTARWRAALQLALVVVIVEGALRKWLFRESEQILYFGKDIVLLGCYFGYWRAQGARRYRLPVSAGLITLLGLAAAWAALEIFNVNLPNLWVGLAGFKAYFFYVPMMFVVPACFESDQEIYQFLRRYFLLVIPVGSLALLQFASPATSRLNTYARSNDEGFVATFGSSEHVRVTATFPFITGFTSYLLALTILLLAFLAAGKWNFRRDRVLYICVAFALLGMLVSGSRTPIYTMAALFPFYWYFAVFRERDAGAAATRAIMIIGVLSVAGSLFAREAVQAFVGRASASTDTASRFTTPILGPWELMPHAGFLGFGTGATHQMAAALAPSIIPYSWMHGLYAEVESGKIMLELGVIGFVLVYSARLALVAIAFDHARRLRTRFHRALATAAFLYFLGQVFGAPVFDVTCGVYYWFFAGLMMLAVRLDLQAVRATAPVVRPLPAHEFPAKLAPAMRWQSPPVSRS